MQPYHRHIFAYPAVKAAVAYMSGILLARWGAISLGGLAIFLGAAFLISCLFLFIRKNTGNVSLPATLSLLLLLAGLGAYRAHDEFMGIKSALFLLPDERRDHEIRATVMEEPLWTPSKVTAVIRIDTIRSVNGSSAPAMDALFMYSPKSGTSIEWLHAGDRIRCRGRIRIPDTARNPGEFDYRMYLFAQRIPALFFPVTPPDIIEPASGPDPSDPGQIIPRLRRELRQRIDTHFQVKHAAFIRGVVLGERQLIDADTRGSFTRSGVVHLLAISGLHVGMISLILLAVLGRLPIFFRFATVSSLLILYMILTGSTPSVVRAVTMCILLLFARLTQRIGSPFNTLAVAAIVILLFRPLELFTAGFQLSFTGVAAILILHPRLDRVLEAVPEHIRTRNYFRAPARLFLLSTAAQIGTAPVVISHFGYLSVMAPAANMLAIPAMFLLLAGTIALLAVSWISTVISLWIASLIEALLDCLTFMTSLLAALPFAQYDIPHSAGIFIGCIAFVLFHCAVSGRGSRRFRWLLLFHGIGALIVLRSSMELIASDQTSIRITMLDVGQGDAIDIALPNGDRVLIDAGRSWRDGDTGKKTIVPYYRRMGVTRLSALILTHPDNDHIGGAPTIIRSLDVQRLVISPFFSGTGAADTLLRVARRRGIRLREVGLGDTIGVGPAVRMYVLRPAGIDTSSGGIVRTVSANESSLLILFVFGRTRFLFTGDLPVAEERRAERQFGAFLSAQVLKVGHHGSHTSSSMPFVSRVKPRIALVSCGRLNRFSHPRPEVLQLFASCGTSVLRTDIEHAVILESDGREIRRVPW